MCRGSRYKLAWIHQVNPIWLPRPLTAGMCLLNLTDVRTNVNKTFKLWLR